MIRDSVHATGFDIARWLIYALLSALTIAIGLLALARQQSDLGISFLAGGIASGLFLFQKVVDDLAANGREVKLAEAYSELSQSFARLDERSRALSGQFQQVRSRLARGADERVVFARHLSDESRTLIEEHDPSQVLEIDVVGISLKQFLADHATILRTLPKLTVRLIILDPEKPFFGPSVAQEGRNPEGMRDQIQQTLNAVKDIHQARTNASLRPEAVNLRWMDANMTATGMRIDTTWMIRPRFQNEANSFKFFFERYDASAPVCFEMVCAHFDAMWEEAEAVPLDQ